MKKTLNIILTIMAIVLLVAAVTGAALGCPYALILIAPAIGLAINPIRAIASKKTKLNVK